MFKSIQQFKQKLIQEGKLSRYFISAIGEIFLLVIGILIALQIDEQVAWNQNRKLEKEYLNAISYELEDDINFYKNVIDSLKIQHSSMRSVIALIENPQIKIIDSLQFINEYRNAGYGDNLNRSAVTWKELQSTGQISLIQNKKLTRKLFKYYDFSERYASDFNKFPLEQRLIARGIEHGLFNLAEHDDYFKNWQHQQIPRNEVYNFVRTNQNLLPHLKSILISSKVQMKIGEHVLALAEEILKSIRTKDQV
jgi:uncharacterized membrane protein YgaE (UPF0421/DUF939 family)